MAGAPRGGLGTRTVSLLNQGSRPGERLRGCGAWRGAWGGTWGFGSGGRGRGPARHLTEGLGQVLQLSLTSYGIRRDPTSQTVLKKDKIRGLPLLTLTFTAKLQELK